MTHTLEAPLGCSDCDKRFIMPNHCALHQMKHGEPQFPCDRCDRKFWSQPDLDCHMSTHTGLKLYKCDQCPKRYAWPASLRKHQEDAHIHRRHYECEACGKKFKSQDGLRGHLRNTCGKAKPRTKRTKRSADPDTGQFQCELCPKLFSQERSLIFHMIKRHDSSHMGEFSCRFCTKSFFCAKGLKMHVKECHEKFVCKKCPATFESEDALEAHESTMHNSEHPDNAREVYTCDVCGKTYRKESRLKKHATKHEKQQREETMKVHECDECEASFNTEEELQAHATEEHTENKAELMEITSEKQREFICECGKGFSSEQRLREHSWKHSGEKPYLCDKCNAAFRREKQLLKHECPGKNIEA